MKRLMLAVVMAAAAAFVGCAQQAARTAAPVAATTDAQYEALWQVALDVTGARFPIVRAERDAGTIETDYLVGAHSMTGFRTNAVGSEVPEEMFHTIRRRALVTVTREDVAVAVAKDRLIRVRPNAVPAGTYALFRPYETLDLTRARWQSEGRDDELEAVIKDEILERYAAVR